jgi:glutamate racemase
LWCTHFPIWENYFRQLFGWEIIDPALESMRQFGPYLSKHSDIADQITRCGTTRIVVTHGARAFLEKAQVISPGIKKVECVKTWRTGHGKQKKTSTSKN